MICRDTYDVYIRTKFDPELVGLTRKKMRCRYEFNAGSSELGKRIVDIEPIGPRKGRGGERYYDRLVGNGGKRIGYARCDSGSYYFGRYGVPFGPAYRGRFSEDRTKSVAKRLYISVPMFLGAMAILFYSMSDATGFAKIWRYFAWSNQTLAVFTLWAVTVWLYRERKFYWVTLVPALFMTAVCTTYIFIAPEGLGLSSRLSYALGMACVAVSAAWFILWARRPKAHELKKDYLG